MKDDFVQIRKLVDSLDKNSRYCVINCSVFIEERASETIGKLLGIEWKESETLGYGSVNIGFDNKIRLIQDLKGIDKISKTKFQCFMAIRNKFAHINEVDSFENYFKVISSSKDRKRELMSWFSYLKWDSEDIEGLYKFVYFRLALELNRILFDIIIKHTYENGMEYGRKQALEKFMEITKSKLSETNNGNLILDSIVKDLKNNIS